MLGLISLRNGAVLTRTAYLHVNFRSMAKVGSELEFEGWLDRAEGLKVRNSSSSASFDPATHCWRTSKPSSSLQKYGNSRNDSPDGLVQSAIEVSGVSRESHASNQRGTVRAEPQIRLGHFLRSSEPSE